MMLNMNYIHHIFLNIACLKCKKPTSLTFYAFYHYYKQGAIYCYGPFHLISTPPCRRRLRRGPENLYFLGVLKMVISEGNKKIAFS